MAIRRDTGTRPLPAPTVSRRGPEYLIAYACFKCRKSFKIAPRQEREALCPGCRGIIFEMGRSFKAPAKRDRGQWAKVEALYHAGFRFFSYRSFSHLEKDVPPLPAKLSQVEAFIRDNPEHPMRVAAPNNSFKPTPLRGAA